MKKKRIARTAMFLAAAALTSHAVPASAEELPVSGVCGENLTWHIETDDRGKVLCIEGTGDMYDYGEGFASYADFLENNQIPWRDHADGPNDLYKVVFSEGVTSVGSFAFFDRRYLSTVELADSITEIGEYAFVNCGEGYAVSTDFEPLPSNLQTIGEGAFLSTYNWMQEIDACIPESVTEIGALAFADFATRYTVPEGVESHLPYGASFTGIDIPETVTSIGTKAIGATVSPEYNTEVGARAVMDAIFTGNAGEYFITTETVTIYGSENSTAHSFAVENGLNFYNKATDVVNGICGDCTWTLTDGTLTIGGEGAMPDIPEEEIMLILDDAGFPVYFKPPHFVMFHDRITSVIIENGVTHIGDGSFTACENLKNVTIGDSVESIGKVAFFFNQSLESVTFPASVQSIGEGAFYHCPQLNSIHVENPNLSIGAAALGYCSDPDIVFSGMSINTALVLHGIAGSTAQTYAEENGIAFNALEMPETETMTEPTTSEGTTTETTATVNTATETAKTTSKATTKTLASPNTKDMELPAFALAGLTALFGAVLCRRK